MNNLSPSPPMLPSQAFADRPQTKFSPNQTYFNKIKFLASYLLLLLYVRYRNRLVAEQTKRVTS
jgi:hypothetical protein